MPLTPARLTGLTVAISLACLAGGCGGDDDASNAKASAAASTPTTAAAPASTPSVPTDLRDCADVKGVKHLMARQGGCQEATALLKASNWTTLGKTPRTVDGYSCATLVVASRLRVIRCTKPDAEVRFTVPRKSSLFLAA